MTTLDQPVRSELCQRAQFASGVRRVPTLIVNAYLVGRPGDPWVLVDTGLPGFAGHVRRLAEQRYGRHHPPVAIVLTHGHFDHAGSVATLARHWDVPVYAHRLELPYLTGRSDYPPQDSTVGGALGMMSRAFPHSGIDLGDRILPLPSDGTIPGMDGWRWHHTPGHTAGHVSLLREADRLLLAGDALATLDQDSWVETLRQSPVFSVPPAPFTTDWVAGHRSVELLARLEPWIVAAGHGRPVGGARVAADLYRFAAIFTPPARGRYVRRPARTDERGVVEVPPPVPDPLPGRLLVGAGLLGTTWLLARRRAGRR